MTVVFVSVVEISKRPLLFNSSVAYWKANRETLTAFDFSMLLQLLSDLASKIRKCTQVLTSSNLTLLGKPETNSRLEERQGCITIMSEPCK